MEYNRNLDIYNEYQDIDGLYKIICVPLLKIFWSLKKALPLDPSSLQCLIIPKIIGSSAPIMKSYVHHAHCLVMFHVNVPKW